MLGELMKCFPSQAFQFLPALELLCKTGFDHLLFQTDKGPSEDDPYDHGEHGCDS